MKEIMKRELERLEAKIFMYKEEIEMDCKNIKRKQEENDIYSILKISEIIKEETQKLLVIKEILKEFKVIAVEEKELFIKAQELEDEINKIVE